MFSNIDQVMNNIKLPEGHVSIWVRSVGHDPGGDLTTIYRMAGYEFVTLTPEETRDAKKREAKIGRHYLDPEGHVRYGDTILMFTTKENRDRILKENEDRGNARLGNRAKAAGLRDVTDGAARAFVANHYRTTRNKDNPAEFTGDGAPEEFKTARPPQD